MFEFWPLVLPAAAFGYLMRVEQEGKLPPAVALVVILSVIAAGLINATP